LACSGFFAHLEQPCSPAGESFGAIVRATYTDARQWLHTPILGGASSGNTIKSIAGFHNRIFVTIPSPKTPSLYTIRTQKKKSHVCAGYDRHTQVAAAGRDLRFSERYRPRVEGVALACSASKAWSFYIFGPDISQAAKSEPQA
jgi:hypothetical protein